MTKPTAEDYENEIDFLCERIEGLMGALSKLEEHVRYMAVPGTDLEELCACARRIVGEEE